MNTNYVKKILGRFNRNKKVVRLADISGDTNWHKHHKFCTNGKGPLPYSYNEGVDLKQRDIFRTAKELQVQGVLEIEYEKGENWFVRPQNWQQEFPNLTFLEVEVTQQ